MAANKKKKKAIQFQIGWPGLIALIISSFCALLWVFALGFWIGQKVVTGNCPKTNVAVYKPKKSLNPSQDVSKELIKEADIPKSLAIKELDQIKQDIKKEATDEIKTEVLDDSKDLTRKPLVEENAKKEQLQPKQIEQVKEPDKGLVLKEKEKEEIKKVSLKKVEQEKKKKIRLRKYFALQIASYKRLEQAKKEAKIWEKKGYFVKIKRANLGRKGIWYRVYIGRYKSLEEAKKASTRLASKEGIRSYVASFGK